MFPIKFKSDYYRMTGNFWNLKGIFSIFLHHNLQFAYWFRKYEEKQTLFRRFFLFKLSKKFGLEISPNAKIGEGLYLGHPYNITVGGVTMGNNVNLHKGCTIGRENRGKREGSPQIGNCVAVGINATIIGNITVGDDVMIAPNSFVNFDVPSHSIVIGNPGVIHSKQNATESYIAYQV